MNKMTCRKKRSKCIVVCCSCRGVGVPIVVLLVVSSNQLVVISDRNGSTASCLVATDLLLATYWVGTSSIAAASY
jgi:hypothetical protein